jgi:hypothetical protein
MPLVKVSLRKGQDTDYKRAILDGVHAALVEAFVIPDHDRHQQIYELDENSFEIPSSKSSRFVKKSGSPISPMVRDLHAGGKPAGHKTQKSIELPDLT